SFFFFSSRRRHTRSKRDWSSDVCSSDLEQRRVQTTAYNMVQLLARLWYVPALFFVATPLAAILNTGTQTTGALLKAIVCAILLEIGRASCRERVYVSGGSRGGRGKIEMG